MAVFGERFLLGFTSPRSPYLIQEYIKVIEENNLNGVLYNSEFQEQFYKALSNARVAGQVAGRAKDPALAGRDKLTRMPQALGFFITQNKKNFQVTDAGLLLKDPLLFEDVMTHQMLKFQLPSPLHKEKETNKGAFRIKPFLEIIRLIYTLDYLTYKELLIFGMTLLDYRNFEDTLTKIKQYRSDRKDIKKRRGSLKHFDYDVQLKLFSDIYKDIIESGKISTRESETKTAEEFMKKKMKNWSDYTDSYFRVLQSSGLLIITKGKSFSISPERRKEVEHILSSVDRDILPVNTPRDVYDKYLSDPNIPYLYNDNKTNLITSLNQLNFYDITNQNIYELKQILGNKRVEQRKRKVAEHSQKLKNRNPDDIEDILNHFDLITSKQIEPASLRPTFFEWNVWRAMTMINHGKVQGNFLVDDSGMPISTAGGNMVDILGDYGNFNIGIEVTLSTGAKQYDMEGEPVPRHIGTLLQDKPSFGLFIADKLQPSVIQHFFVTAVMESDVYNGRVDIIPMNTLTFIEFFKKAIQKDIQPDDLFSIHEYSLKLSRENLFNSKTERDWHQGVLDKMFDIVS